VAKSMDLAANIFPKMAKRLILVWPKPMNLAE
jgi:hypothetical protein